MAEVNSVRDGYILTAKSKRFYFRDPKPEDFDIEVIAHALAQIPRFGGHGKFPYSVAQHSIACAVIAWDLWRDPRKALTMLLHDGSEAMGFVDLPRPIKMQLDGYLDAEDVVQSALAEAHGTVYPLTPELKLIDNRMLVTEAPFLFSIPSDAKPWWLEDHWPGRYTVGDGIGVRYEMQIEPKDWQKVKADFLNVYGRFKGAMWAEC